MAISATLIWFLGVLLLALVISAAAVVLGRARLSRGKGEGESPLISRMSHSPGIGRWGLVCSVIGLILAIYLYPVGKFLNLPEDLGFLTFFFSLLAFPIFAALGLILSVIGYLLNRHRVNLIAGAVGGLAFVWLAATIFILSTTGCAAATIEVNGTVQSVDSSSVVVDGQTVVIGAVLLPLPRQVTPGNKVHLWAYKTINGGLTACRVEVDDANETPDLSEIPQAER